MYTLRAIGIIWYREVLLFWRNRPRILSSIGMAVVFLFVFGSGLSSSMGGLARGLPGIGGEIDYVKFLFPGIVGMNVLMTSMMTGIGIVYDREFGFLKEILVAPLSRWAVALGKTLGGATSGVVQGLLILALAPLVGIGLTPELILKLIPLTLLIAVAMTSVGVFIGSTLKSTESFQVVVTFITMPMIFVSGAFFPTRGLPPWMDIVIHLNPVTYAIDPMRRLVFEAQGLPQEVLAQFAQIGFSVSLGGNPLSVQQDIAIITGFGALMLALAVNRFSVQN